jgi:cyclopropane fatty-acyl-phospholipid synthase-like methyltransferase
MSTTRGSCSDSVSTVPGEALPHDAASLKSYYDARYAGTYMAGHSPLEVERVTEVLATITPETPRTILDFGCGRGAWIPVLQHQFPTAHITGLDVSPVAVERARADFPAVSSAGSSFYSRLGPG